MRSSKQSGSVLIETLWNVKLEEIPPVIDYCLVLIETLWNVKGYMDAFH